MLLYAVSQKRKKKNVSLNSAHLRTWINHFPAFPIPKLQAHILIVRDLIIESSWCMAKASSLHPWLFAVHFLFNELAMLFGVFLEAQSFEIKLEKLAALLLYGNALKKDYFQLQSLFYAKKSRKYEKYLKESSTHQSLHKRHVKSLLNVKV